jgi:hypothetical protein
MKRCLLAAFGVLAVAWTLTAQRQETFKARLSPVPVDAQLAPVIAGHGSVTAVLAGIRKGLDFLFTRRRAASASDVAHDEQMFI